MRTDHVDIVFIHDPELHYRQAVRGAYRALDELRRDGTIGAISVSMNQACKLRPMADDGDFDAFLLAGRYRLLDQSAATDLFPVTCERGIGVILAGVFNSGILANPSAGTSFDYRPASPARMAEVWWPQAACERHGVSLKAAAIQF